ncbi:hypothetical protein mvi_02770 [Methylobacterium indicum]|uniref:Uncharacterized protein n=1 Tax=Methylobacterium indicum TaxID=1775910 RepID=A0A8H9C3F8_9HYPH|nr:hypothetical protein mvi_02770 [Methylobacterium indicum]
MLVEVAAPGRDLVGEGGDAVDDGHVTIRSCGDGKRTGRMQQAERRAVNSLRPFANGAGPAPGA